jgi:acetyltransferase (GNAT) family protein
MTNFDKCVDGSGWLSMARTDPAWRRRGVAIYLQRQIIDYAKRRGVGPLRLWVLSKNKASINACEKGGFKRVCEAAHVSCRLRVKRKRKRVPPTSVSNSQLQSFLRSGYTTKMNGYIAREWHFMKGSEHLLRRLERYGELYVAEDSIFLVTRPEIRFEEPQSSLTILVGPVPKSMRSAKKIAGALGAKILSSYIPYEPYQLSIAKKCGFNRSVWGKHCLVFEKKI